LRADDFRAPPREEDDDEDEDDEDARFDAPREDDDLRAPARLLPPRDDEDDLRAPPLDEPLRELRDEVPDVDVPSDLERVAMGSLLVGGGVPLAVARSRHARA
jgi:hypothetical protein